MNAKLGTNVFSQSRMALLVLAGFVTACNSGAMRVQSDAARAGTAIDPSSAAEDLPAALQPDERVTALRARYDELSARHQTLLRTVSDGEEARAEVWHLNGEVDSLVNELTELTKQLAELTTTAGDLDRSVQSQGAELANLNALVVRLNASNADMQRRIQELDRELNPTREMWTALWYLLVETSDIENAGTDAKLQVILGYAGGSASSPMADLAHNENERGSKEFYLFRVDQLVPVNLESFTLTHSNSGKKPGWHCRRARLVAFVENNSRAFVVADTYVNRWLKDLNPGLKAEVPVNAKPVELSAPERDAILSAIAAREAKSIRSKAERPVRDRSDDLSPLRSGA